jgi:toxin ParE1/3/4
MPRLRILPSAERDLSRPWAFIADRYSPASARRFVRQVLKKAQLLSEFPGIGAERDELAPGTRSFPLGKYVLYYHRIEDGIELRRVLHGSRRLPEAFEQEGDG